MIIDATKIKYYADYPISDSYLDKSVQQKTRKSISRKKSSAKKMKH